ncbi:winged helix-turn-helix transcriptional regulator [Nocardia sp. NBC_00416]|uniref:winged helix-turn-helix transcriptional regulator n=1 Tax=Nocardia sp. NBC_00416 TaxID=2975991 RepID=UPI002E229351
MIEGSCQVFVSDCHVRAATELINHTWDPVVLSALRLGPTRRNELLARITGASDKVLTQSLQRLRSRGLITKPVTSQPTNNGAIYRLTALGESFAHGPLAHLAQWAADNHTELTEPHSTS